MDGSQPFQVRVELAIQLNPSWPSVQGPPLREREFELPRTHEFELAVPWESLSAVGRIPMPEKHVAAEAGLGC